MATEDLITAHADEACVGTSSGESHIQRAAPEQLRSHDLRRREKDRGKTKGLITSYRMRVKTWRRKSLRHDGDVGPETVRARDHFWSSRLRSLHTIHGMWLTSVDHIKWKHVRKIAEHTLEHYPVATQKAYFSHLAWGLTALEKPDLVHLLAKHLAGRGVRLHQPQT
jgi:hypothetical protein